MNTGHGSKSPREMLPFAPQVYAAPEESSAGVDALRAELKNEVRALRSLVTRSATPSQDLSLEIAAIRASLAEMQPATPKRDRTSAWLRQRGIEGGAATRIAALAKAAAGDTRAKLRAALAEIVPLSPWTDGERKIVAVVGPSGVGKTTTIAKLAAHARMNGRSVALVSCDAFRVGAIDQLERYAELLDVPFAVARTSAELGDAIDAADADLVFVDTSGRPPGPASPEMVLAARRQSPSAIDVILCMSATTRAADAARIAATFAPLKPSAVAVTKIDETESPSGLVHAPFAAKRPLAVICSGPRVPEDVAPATLDAILDHLDPQGDDAKEIA
jgi:flagellar biosynthesis protein FlhF